MLARFQSTACVLLPTRLTQFPRLADYPESHQACLRNVGLSSNSARTRTPARGCAPKTMPALWPGVSSKTGSKRSWPSSKRVWSQPPRCSCPTRLRQTARPYMSTSGTIRSCCWGRDMSPEDFNIHDPAWWAQEDAAILARLQEFNQIDPNTVSPET